MVEGHSEDYYLRKLLKETKIKEVMLRPPVTIDENESISNAWLKFNTHKTGHLIVVNSMGILLGLISQKYLYRAHSPRKVATDLMPYSSDMIIDGDRIFSKETLDSLILKQIMKHNPLSMKSDESVAAAIINMEKYNIACIPIVNKEQKVIGTLSDLNIVHYLAGILNE